MIVYFKGAEWIDNQQKQQFSVFSIIKVPMKNMHTFTCYTWDKALKESRKEPPNENFKLKCYPGNTKTKQHYELYSKSFVSLQLRGFYNLAIHLIYRLLTHVNTMYR